MKKLIIVFLLMAVTVPVVAQSNRKETKERDRIDLCKKNFTALFGGEALTGQGTDPECRICYSWVVGL